MAEPTKASILIVEDDPATALLQQRLLERSGYATVAVHTATDALATLVRTPIDLILLDQMLPDTLSGLHFIEQLKDLGYDIPVIVVTGRTDEGTAIGALRAGARDFIPKNAEFLDYLSSAVERVLRQIRMERQLAEHEARLAALIDSAKDAIIVVEPDRTISLFNRGAERIFRCSASEAIGGTIQQFIPDQAELQNWKVLNEIPDAQASPSVTLHLRAGNFGIRHDGERFPIETSVSKVEVQGRKFYTLLVRDITERLRAEQQLRAQATLLNQAGDAILVLDLKGRIRFWNHSAGLLYGWRAEETLGVAATEVFGTMPSLTEQNLSLDNGAMAFDPLLLGFTRKPVSFAEAFAITCDKGAWQGELQQLTKYNQEIIVSSRWTLIGEPGLDAGPGEQSSVLVIITDITERKRLEREMQRTQRLESIGVLAGGIAHDLNNVLTPILMASELLLSRVEDVEARSMLNMLRASTERGAELVKQILKFARGSEGQRMPLYLPPLIKEVAKLLAQTLPKSIRLVVDVPQEIWLVSTEATQLQQVVMNLAVNARDAMPRGGLLTIEARNVTLPLIPNAGIPANQLAQLDSDSESDSPSSINQYTFGTPHPGDAYVELTVSDTGVGIGSNTIERIFTPFFTTKEVGKGTGLGLSTTGTIVTACDGFIHVQSQVGAGAIFKVYFPGLQTEARDPVLHPAPPIPVAQGELILVVDDEASIREVARAILEAHGYRVITAANGAEGFASFAEHQTEVAVVLTDLAMPVMDGATLSRLLVQLDPKVCIVTTSGYSRSEVPPDLPGVRASLAKPYAVDALLRTVREVLHPTLPTG